MNSTTKDLAKLVHKKIKGVNTYSVRLTQAALNELFESLFFASLKTEEGQLIKVTVTLINSKNPDPNPPLRKVAHRWNYIPFKEKLLLDVKNLVKLSKAADPLSSSLAVEHDGGKLYIWGMIDQSGHYQNFLNYEADSGPEQPGLFQVTIDDIGSLSVMLDYQLIANLKQNTIISNYADVFYEGPVANIIMSKAEELRLPVRQYILQEFGQEYGFELLDNWEGYLEGIMAESICRILLRMKNYHHGGAFLITSDCEKGLDIKHKLSYNRLAKSIANFTKFSIASSVYAENIVDDFLDEDKEQIPSFLYSGESVAQFDKEETDAELKGAISFVASLSCIDGLVVMSHNLHIEGFGVVINEIALPETIYICQDAEIIEEKLISIPPYNYGTRHRSMFSYCWNNEGSLGFVVSQDGDVRAISKVSGKLVMWENVKIKRFARSSKLSKRKKKIAS